MTWVFRLTDPWNYRRSNFYGCISGTQSCSSIGPQRDPLLSSCLYLENTGTKSQIVLSWAIFRSQFAYTSASFQFCSAHYAFRRVGTLRILTRLVGSCLKTIWQLGWLETWGRLEWRPLLYFFGLFLEGHSNSPPFDSFAASFRPRTRSKSIRLEELLRKYTEVWSSRSKYFQYS